MAEGQTQLHPCQLAAVSKPHCAAVLPYYFAFARIRGNLITAYCGPSRTAPTYTSEASLLQDQCRRRQYSVGRILRRRSEPMKSCAELRLAYIFQSDTLVEPNDILPHPNRKAGRESASSRTVAADLRGRRQGTRRVTTTGRALPATPIQR